MTGKKVDLDRVSYADRYPSKMIHTANSTILSASIPIVNDNRTQGKEFCNLHKDFLCILYIFTA